MENSTLFIGEALFRHAVRDGYNRGDGDLIYLYRQDELHIGYEINLSDRVTCF